VTALPGDVATVIVERLRRLDTSALSDALDSFGRAGVVTGIAPIWRGARIAGRVVPVQLVPAGEAVPPPHHLGTAAIEAGGPDDVIVVDNRGRVEMGGWGGLLARGASTRGVAGVVVDGACRDADEMEEIGFPVFARATTARTARGRVVERLAEEIEIGGLPVRRGDFVLADRTAVVFVRADQAEEVVTVAEAIVTREAAMATAISQGLPITSVMGLAYEDLLARISAETNVGDRR
jgi:4-hydroxy-4-methyl-2-oxoglutarate aldolase